MKDRQVAAALAAIGLVAYLVTTFGETTVFDYFGRLAVAITQGHLWLDGAPPHLNELATGTGGHQYSAVPPLPAILIIPLLPFGPPATLQTLLSAAAGGLIAAPLYLGQRALGVPGGLALGTSIFSIFGTGLWITAVDGRSWFAAGAIGTLFLSLAFWCAAARGPWIILGALLGAAILSRLPMALALPGLLLLASRGDIRAAIRALPPVALGLAPFLAVQGAYNLARWGTIGDAGYAILVENDPFYPHGLFDVRYVPRHLYALFFEPPSLVESDPFFLRARSIGMSVLVTAPPLLWIARAATNGRTLWATAPLALACLPLLPDIVYGGIGFEQYGYRRSLDVLPFLVALATIGGGWTGNAWLPRGTPLFRAALVVSVLINVYFLIEIHRFGYAR